MRFQFALWVLVMQAYLLQLHLQKNSVFGFDVGHVRVIEF